MWKKLIDSCLFVCLFVFEIIGYSKNLTSFIFNQSLLEDIYILAAI
jgi:hypothetical protein